MSDPFPLAVIFDFDGVLADTERLHYGAFRDVLAEHGWTLDEHTYFDRYLGFDDDALMREFARDLGVALSADDRHALVHRKTHVFQQRLAAGHVLYPGATPAVRRLGAQFQLGIASGSLSEEIRLVLDAAFLAPHFGVVVGADDVVRTKPAPDPYLAAVRALGVEPASAVAIEDSRWGLESAVTAGLRTIAVTTSYAASALGSAEVVVSSLDDVTVELVSDLLSSRPRHRPADVARG